MLRQKGQEDVARMKQGGVRNLFTKVTGKYGEALAQEQAEAAEAETKYQRVQREIAQMEDSLRQLDKRIGELSGSQARYDAYILQRAEELEEAGTDSGMKDLQARIRVWKNRSGLCWKKEIGWLMYAGKSETCWAFWRMRQGMAAGMQDAAVCSVLF